MCLFYGFLLSSGNICLEVEIINYMYDLNFLKYIKLNRNYFIVN